VDVRLFSLIVDYQAAVSSAVKLLEASGIARPKTNTAWACNGIDNIGTLAGGVQYRKHGYGCAVHLKSGEVDFDFGENGEIDGVDTWRLSVFAEGKLSQYGFASEDELEATFKSAVASGHLVYSGYILHYVRDASA
jgi:hypothetical protein